MFCLQVHLCRLALLYFDGGIHPYKSNFIWVASVTSVNLLQWKLDMEILLHVVLYLAKSRCISQEKWNDSEFACLVRLSIVFFECYFKPFLCLLDVKKPKYFPHQGSAMNIDFRTPSCFPDTFSATNINFFSVLNLGTY